MENFTNEQLKTMLVTVIETQGSLSKRMLQLNGKIVNQTSEDKIKQLREEIKQLKNIYNQCLEEEQELKRILENK